MACADRKGAIGGMGYTMAEVSERISEILRTRESTEWFSRLYAPGQGKFFVVSKRIG